MDETPQQDASQDPTGPSDALHDMHDRLTGQIDELESLSRDAEEGFADTAQVAAEHDEQRALIAELRELLDDVERALARLDEGTYGTCEVCGQTIADERLAELPATRFCISHAV